MNKVDKTKKMCRYVYVGMVLNIFQDYGRQWVIIKDKNAVLGDTLKTHEMGTFLFWRVVPEKESVQRFFSGVLS